jgi:hypothetical protein
MANFTPGPWHLGGIGNPLTDPRYNIWGLPANWLPAKGMQSGECIAQDVTPANARLIAAAPEMYEALLLAKQEIMASGNWGAHDYNWPEVCTKIDAAIAKAVPHDPA